MIFVLIGMPGAGKSSLGRVVAKRLHMRLIDVDKLIEKEQGQQLYSLINERGRDAFCALEEDALCRSYEDNTIISTGGSAIYYPRAMEHLRSIGKIIYLYASLDTIIERIGDFSKRGVLMRPGQTIEDLFLERCALYNRYADAVVNCDGNSYPKFHNRLENTMRAFMEMEDPGISMKYTTGYKTRKMHRNTRFEQSKRESKDKT